MKTRWITTLTLVNRRYRPGILRVRPGDILVVQAHGRISEAEAQNIKRHVEERLGYRVPVLVLSNDAGLTIVRPPAQYAGR